ncbi:MAG: hypothetical protein PWQ72_2085 [Pseudothermotoga sp.]|nr:hypothetical protein [Pseudothermotoga sp.]MDK2954487.1 hypothetical protein [Kosmotoga sp.]
MPGFLGEISKSVFNKFGDTNLLVECIEGKNYYLERRTIRKFESDKVFYEDDRYVIITEGVILNSLALMEKYKSVDLKNTIVRMYEENGERFFSEFRGAFSGFL